MNNISVIFEDQLLGSNEMLVRSICAMWYYGAFDIIFIPYQDKVDIKVKFPIKNKLFQHSNNVLATIDIERFKKLKMCIKLSCNLNILNENEPHTASFSVKINMKNFSIRCSFHPTNYGESLCLRIIKSSVFEKISHIGNKINKGLNIIGGRTCSGKTTLLYSSILNFNGHVITLEDPVEFLLENISQTDVSIMGYEEGIKSALRQNPDLICIGEIRDEISAKAAVKAALTGHCVLATIHIISTEKLIYRLKDFNCQMFEEVLNYVFFMDNFIRTDFKYEDGKFYQL